MYQEGRHHFYKFYGYDFLELLDKWNVPYDIYQYDIKEDEMTNLFMEYMWQSCMASKRIQKVFLKDLRDFIKALSEHDSYEQPIWKAYLEVQDDYSFMRLVKPMLPYMWR